MIPKGQGETTELTDETRALMPPQVLAAMDSYLQGKSQLSDLDLIRIPANKIEDLLIQDGNEAEIESLFEPPTPNLGNVFVGSSELCHLHQRRPLLLKTFCLWEATLELLKVLQVSTTRSRLVRLNGGTNCWQQVFYRQT